MHKEEDRRAQPYGAYTQPCSFLHRAPPRYESYARAHFPGSSSQRRQASLGKGEKDLGDDLSSGDPAAPITNSNKSSCVLTTTFPSTPPLAGLGPGCIKHVSAGQGWKVNKSASCVSISCLLVFFFSSLRTELILTSAELGTSWLFDFARLPWDQLTQAPFSRLTKLHRTLPGSPGWQQELYPSSSFS